MFQIGNQTQVFEAMTHDVVWVSPEVTLASAARTMKCFDVGILPVCENNRLLGLVTDRDIVVRAAAEGRDPEHARVAEVMSTEITCCLETDEVQDAARRMLGWQVHRLLVVDRYGKLVGVVSLADLIRKTGDSRIAGAILDMVSEQKGSEA
jgi:CBS domain-containing protein